MQVKRIQNGELGELCIGHPGSALYSVLPSALAVLPAGRGQLVGRFRSRTSLNFRPVCSVFKAILKRL